MIQTTLEKLVADHPIKVALLDAHGVLYNEDGAFPGSAAAVRFLQSRVEVKLVTNNSYLSPSAISDNLGKLGIHVAANDVISSGAGLTHDPEISELIRGKHVLMLGRPDSLEYVENASPRSITRLPDDPITPPDVIVVTSSFDDQSLMNDLIARIGPWRELPIVCCNPDRFVMLRKGMLYPVIGYYADQIAARWGVSIRWVGKPCDNFSQMVSGMLTESGVNYLSDVVFFDDNPENVGSMQRSVGISGCWIQDTGLGGHPSQFPVAPWEQTIRFAIPALALDS